MNRDSQQPIDAHKKLAPWKSTRAGEENRHHKINSPYVPMDGSVVVVFFNFSRAVP